MSLIFATQLAGVATLALAILAGIIAWYARRAYLAQSDELKEQRKLNRKQTDVLKLQGDELRESLDERRREARERERAQAL